MSERWFSFGELHSDEAGIEVTALPSVYLPQRRLEAHTVPGRSGTLKVWDGAYEPLSLSVGIYLPYEQGRAVESLTKIIWMMDGEAWLMLSDRPHKRYRAMLDNGAELLTWFEGFSEKMATLIFSAEPFGYLIDNDPVVCTESGTRVDNRGNVASEPVLVIEGEGDVNIAIGSQLMSIAGLVSGVPLTIDCESALASEGGVNAAGKITGELPKLSPGFNAITWTGSISKITVTVNARELG